MIPFLAVGLFTGAVLDFFRRHRKVVAYTAKIGGVLMILMGIMMITGWMNSLTGYLSSFGGASGGGTTSSSVSEPASSAAASSAESSSENEETGASSSAEEADREKIPAPDGIFYDQYGNAHNLQEYDGKVVFLNFWTTWCGYCKQEMPDIEEIYQEYGLNREDVVILGVANPVSDKSSYSQDSQTAEQIAAFLEENGWTYPVLMMKRASSSPSLPSAPSPPHSCSTKTATCTAI